MYGSTLRHRALPSSVRPSLQDPDYVHCLGYVIDMTYVGLESDGADVLAVGPKEAIKDRMHLPQQRRQRGGAQMAYYHCHLPLSFQPECRFVDHGNGWAIEEYKMIRRGLLCTWLCSSTHSPRHPDSGRARRACGSVRPCCCRRRCTRVCTHSSPAALNVKKRPNVSG